MASSGGSSLPSTKKEEILDEEDRISELPEFLLVHILSLLPLTKDAFAARLLSKRWRYIWISLHSFKFVADDFIETENSPSFIEHVLAHSVSPKIRKLEFRCFEISQNKSQINQWLSFATEKNVEEVILSSPDGGEFTLPQSFCTCSSLIALSSLFCPFKIDGFIQWNNLKSIYLYSWAISDADLANLLSGCPALESMDLIHFHGFHRLEINSLKLKRLSLGSYSGRNNDGSDSCLEIIAPYLQHLEISGNLYDLKCRLVDVSSLVSAKLTFEIKCDWEICCRDYHQAFSTLVQDYLQKLSCVDELILGTWFTKALCMLQFKGVSNPEMKCKYVTLKLVLKYGNLYGVGGLLRASPHVEKLNIDMEATPTINLGNSRCHFESSCLAKGDINVDLQSTIPSFVFPNLKEVKIGTSLVEIIMAYLDSGFCLKDYSELDFDNLFKLSESLLRDATILEKFIIITKKMKCKRCSTNCLSLYLFRLTEKLLCCPRSSASSLIIFQRYDPRIEYDPKSVDLMGLR